MGEADRQTTEPSSACKNWLGKDSIAMATRQDTRALCTIPKPLQKAMQGGVVGCRKMHALGAQRQKRLDLMCRSWQELSWTKAGWGRKEHRCQVGDKVT
jgi:hypothetical protein